MRSIEILKLAAGAGLIAAILFALAAAPGFLTDTASTTPARLVPTAQR